MAPVPAAKRRVGEFDLGDANVDGGAFSESMEYELWDGEERGEDYGNSMRVPSRKQRCLFIRHLEKTKTNEYSQNEEWSELG